MLNIQEYEFGSSEPWQDLTISKLLTTTPRANPYLLSYDKFIITKENKCSQLSLKMPQSLFLSIERLELLIYTFIIQQIPSLSPEIPVILFTRRLKKKDLKALYSSISLSYEILRILNIMYTSVFFSFSKLDTSFRVCGPGGKITHSKLFWKLSFAE